MSPQSTSERVAALVRFSRGAGAAVILLALLVLLGWLLDVPALKSVIPGLVTMKANTALAFVLAGLSLRLVLSEPAGESGVGLPRAIGQVLALPVALIGLVTLCEYLTGWDLGIDQRLFVEAGPAVGTSALGRMAPHTAVSFLLIGIAVLLLDRAGSRPAQVLALGAAAMALAVLMSYAYNPGSVQGIASHTQMAVHTAAAFFLLSIGILCARAGRGLMALVTADDVGGVIARRLLPAVVIVPAVLGWLRLQGERAGLYGTDFGTALFATTSIGVLGCVIYVTAGLLSRDVTERRWLEKALQEKTEELDRYFTSALDLLCIADTDGRFRRLSKQWEDTLGYSLAELEGQRFLDFVHPDDVAATLDALSRLTAQAPVLNFTNRYRCNDGSYRWLEWRSLPAGPLIYAVARDITAQKQDADEVRRLHSELEQRVAQLEAVNKELEAFSYSVSHDLRAPLRAIDGFSQVLLEDHLDTLAPEGQDTLRRVRAAAQRMGELIDALLQLSRAGRVALQRASVNLSALGQTIASELHRTAPDRSVQFHVQDGLVVDADPQLLRLVMENLLGNAWKFTSTKPEAVVELGATRQDDQLVYFVRDNGVGFNMAYAGKLFAPFQRLHSDRQFPGTGIGLATVSRIIDRHGGRMWAQGAVGEGATFYWTLPAPRQGDQPPWAETRPFSSSKTTTTTSS